MAKPNKPYIAGSAIIPAGAVDFELFSNIFAAEVAAAGLTSWKDLIVGVGNNYVFTFNKEITVKYGYPNQAGVIVKGDAAIWRNPTPTTLYRVFEDIQERDNHTLKLKEVYITNNNAIDTIVDVEIFANNNGPFVN